MKKALLIVLSLATASAFADVNFSTKKNFTTQSTITWEPVDNVQARCDRESKARGLGGFGYGVEACSFWDYKSNGDNICTIITGKNTSHDTIGHELRHCFQGPWHS
jgi:hypothetical protein